MKRRNTSPDGRNSYGGEGGLTWVNISFVKPESAVEKEWKPFESKGERGLPEKSLLELPMSWGLASGI